MTPPGAPSARDVPAQPHPDGMEMNAHATLRRMLLAALIAATLLLGACAGGEVEAPQQPGASEATEDTGSAAQQPAQTGPVEEPPGMAKPEEQALVEREDLQPQLEYKPDDEIMVRRPWVQIRTAPDPKAGAVALAYGNDVYTVVAVQGDWVQVRWQDGKLGWIPISAATYEDTADPDQR